LEGLSNDLLSLYLVQASAANVLLAGFQPGRGCVRWNRGHTS